MDTRSLVSSHLATQALSLAQWFALKILTASEGGHPAKKIVKIGSSLLQFINVAAGLSANMLTTMRPHVFLATAAVLLTLTARVCGRRAHQTVVMQSSRYHSRVSGTVQIVCTKTALHNCVCQGSRGALAYAMTIATATGTVVATPFPAPLTATATCAPVLMGTRAPTVRNLLTVRI